MIFYYISSHGFGHAARSCEVIRNLPNHVPVVIRSAVPAWFLAEELRDRPYTLLPGEFDCGVLGPDSSVADMALTIERASAIESRNAGLLDDEVALLGRHGARVVVADVVPFALRVAHKAGVPSVLIANFTWPGIYAPLLADAALDVDLRRRADAVMERMQADYDLGSLLLETTFAIPMQACRERQKIGLITRRGRRRRAELAQALGLDPAHPIHLIYIGRDGLRDMQWNRMDELRPAQFIAFGAIPGAERWVHLLDKSLFSHADAVASVDAVIAKPGYGICAECIAAGTPMLYLPRPHFIEADAIEAELQRWGGAARIEEDAFKRLEWSNALKHLDQKRSMRSQLKIDGSTECVRRIVEAGRLA